jgi:hypothetical protein
MPNDINTIIAQACGIYKAGGPTGPPIFESGGPAATPGGKADHLGRLRYFLEISAILVAIFVVLLAILQYIE